MPAPDELPVKVYSPESSATHPARLVGGLFGDVLAGRELAWRLAVRDISAQYRQAALGLLWALILTARDWLTGFPAEHLASFLLINAVVLVLLLVVGVVFRLAMPMLIERMGS